MKMIWAPSQVMREGRDLNQHGQAGRQEQASSSSPVIFHEVLFAAVAALPGMPNALMPHAIAIETIDLLDMISFINIFLSLKRCHFLGRMYSRERSGQYRKRQRQWRGRILIPLPTYAARREETQRLRCSVGRCARRGSLKAAF